MKESTEKLFTCHDINTFMATADNETHLIGMDQNGDDIHIVFNTFDLLEWLDIDHMKEQTVKYIKTK